MEQGRAPAFSFISINWRGRPLRTYETVIGLIGNTTNRGGLIVRARLDRRSYPIGNKVSAKDLRELKIDRDGAKRAAQIRPYEIRWGTGQAYCSTCSGGEGV